MPEPKTPFDSFPNWKTAPEAWLEAWSKMMNDTISGEEFVGWMGKYLDAYMEAAGPVRRRMQEAQQQLVRQWNLPTQDDLTQLAERLTNLELRVDDLDAKADQMLDLLKAIHAQVNVRLKPAPGGPARKQSTRRTGSSAQGGRKPA